MKCWNPKLTFVAAVAAVVIALVAPASRASAAQGEDPEELIKEGVKLRRQGDHERAEGYFRRAFHIAATPRSAAQLGLVELALGEYLEAETHLSLALDGQDAWVTTNRASIEKSRVAARKHLVRVELSAVPPETTVSRDGAPAAAVAGDAVLWISAGKPSALRFEAPAHKPAVVQVEGAEGETRRVALDMPAIVAPPVARAPEPAPATPSPEPAPATPPSSDQPSGEPAPTHAEATPGATLRWTGIGVGALGVVAGAVGAVLLVEGNSKVSDIESSKTYNAADGNYATLQNAGVGLLIGGGVALAGGAALYLVGRHAATEAAPASGVSFAPSPGGGLVAWRGQF
jgi:hypothetical protein